MSTQSQGLRPGILYPNAQWYFLAAIATTWIGFSRSYFLRLGEVTVFHHIHGAMAGLWMALVIVQPILYQRGKIRLHRKLGRIGVYVIFPLLVIGGQIMIRTMVHTQQLDPPHTVYALGFDDMVSSVLLIFFVTRAIVDVKNVQLHARWMVCTVMQLLPPALTRALFFIPGLHTLLGNAMIATAIVVGILGLLMLDDYRKQGRVLPPYLVAFGAQALMTIALPFVDGWGWWHRLLNAYTGFHG